MDSKGSSTVASWLVRSSPDRAVRVRTLAGDTGFCSWAWHLTLTVPLSTQEYKWVPANCWGNLTKLRGSDLPWTSIPSRGSRNGNRDKIRHHKPVLASRLHFFTFFGKWATHPHPILYRSTLPTGIVSGSFIGIFINSNLSLSCCPG